jgi:predicted GNAT family N-acyltransferase
MALKTIEYGSAEYNQMVKLRYELLRKPLGLSFTDEELEKEKDEIMIGSFEDDKINACCILIKADTKTVRLRQMAVVNKQQGTGIGRALMNFAENVAHDAGYRKMTMHARKTATGFYEKLGYRVCSNEFLEVTIPHYVMEKDI